MTLMTRPPAFASPPLVEVALSVQFEPIEGLFVAQLGRLWDRYRHRYPKTEDYPPLPTHLEHFGAARPRSQIGLRLVSGQKIVPRIWFLNSDDTELLQIQTNRFVRNWRKADDVSPEYPRYDSLRASFVTEYRIFLEYLEEVGLASPEINQCEVTYVNLIPGGGLPGLTVFSEAYSDDFLHDLEAAELALRYLIRDNEEIRGRLHIQAISGLPSQGPAMRLTLTARGLPIGSQTEGALQFFDLGHRWIVDGFCSATSPKMHQLWRKQE